MQTYLLHEVFSLKSTFTERPNSQQNSGSIIYIYLNLDKNAFCGLFGLKKMETNQNFHLGSVVRLELDWIWVISAKIDWLSVGLTHPNLRDVSELS